MDKIRNILILWSILLAAVTASARETNGSQSNAMSSSQSNAMSEASASGDYDYMPSADEIRQIIFEFSGEDIPLDSEELLPIKAEAVMMPDSWFETVTEIGNPKAEVVHDPFIESGLETVGDDGETVGNDDYDSKPDDKPVDDDGMTDKDIPVDEFAGPPYGTGCTASHRDAGSAAGFTFLICLIAFALLVSKRRGGTIVC